MRVLRRWRSLVHDAGGDHDPDVVNLTPLIDIVLIILIFFMVTASFDTLLNVEIDPAAVSDAVPLNEDGAYIALSGDGSIYLDGQRLALGDLRERLRSRLDRKPDTLIIIGADARTGVAALLKVINAAHGAGARRISLGAARSEDGAFE